MATKKAVKVISPATKKIVNINTPKASYLNKETGKFMGTAGLGALLGMGVELAKLRKKILDKWEIDKLKALENNEPPPPRPDTSKGALLAMLKGAGFGALAGGTVGMLPGIGTVTNDVAASMHGAVRKYLGGSRLTDGNKMAFFSMLNYIEPKDLEVFSHYDPVLFEDADLITSAELIKFSENLKNFSKKKRFIPPSSSKKTTTKASITRTTPPVPKNLIEENKYIQEDKKLLGKPSNVLPVLGAIGGGGLAAYKAYKKDLELWEQMAAEYESKGIPLPTKPVLADYIGEFTKGGIVGGVAGALVGKTGIGKTISSHMGDQNDWVINRKTGNAAVKEIQRGQERVSFSEINNWVKKVSNIKNFNEYQYKTNISDTEIKQLNFSYNEYLDSLEKRGLKTSMTETEFNNALNNPTSKGILIDIYKGGIYDI